MQPTLTSTERRRLRGRAQLLEPQLKLGRDGATPAFVEGVRVALAQHALVKIKLVDHKEERHALAETLATQTESALVQVVGHVVVLYRPRPSV